MGEAEAEAEAILKQEEGGGKRENHPMEKSRKEKRKEMKKIKRKQLRKEAAEKEREAEEARLNDPEEQKRIAREEEEELKRREIALNEFEERERSWIEAMEMKRKAQEDEEQEEKKMNDLNEDSNGEQRKQEEMGDDWEYVEEGPAEIIWQGNEIIVRKKKVRVPKGEGNQKSKGEDADRPTSNPLPPQSEAFADYLNASSAQQVLESVAKEVPNFGTEQDKAHCPFHLKTGACRFGQRCSRVHFYPDKSCTLLIRNMYNGPGLAWEQDEGLEYTDEEVERCYEEFYEDVHTEFLKFGEIVNFKVCKNGSFHLRGNVYVHYKLLESAVLAYDSINGRYFAGKQVQCEFVNITRWKVAICGEFMKSRFKTCSHGTACNFIHCFRNPGGDYEWADLDKPPPRYWVKKMAALFGYADEAVFEKQTEQEHSGHSRTSRMVKLDDGRHYSRRSKSREKVRFIDGAQESKHSQRGMNNDRKQRKILDGRWDGQNTSLKWDQNSERSHDTSSDGGCLDSQMGKNNDRKQTKILDERLDRQSKSLKRGQNSERIHDTSSDGGYSESDINGTRDTDQVRRHCHAKKNSKRQNESSEYLADHKNIENRVYEDTENLHGHTKKRRRHCSKVGYPDDDGGSDIQTHKDNGDQLNRDRDNEKHCSHGGKSSRHHIKESPLDDLGASKNRTNVGDSLLKQSSRVSDREGRHHDRQKSLGNLDQVSGLLDDHGKAYGTSDSNSSDHGSERDKRRHHGHRRKRSRHVVECSEFPDASGHQAKKLKGKRDLKRYRHSTHRYETDSSEDYEMKHNVKRRSHGHKRHDEKKPNRDS
ncbi:zinc finger CCCH domain-containing protein 5-like [Durio zibethinus]|uniref:Zinc finger CCCH domain-containing protein 5-like n=1 Tax=Durio zibethinus TaxID=66656 RepID=A0A6P5X0J9_DURZI|nr:zinc finger CCCH domain-containing protein 5-like [Durio zibethinus]